MKPYVSKGVRISQSRSHENMFIFDFPDGSFFPVHSSESLILATHPADGSRFVRDYKQFPHTSSYKPQANSATSFAKQARSHGRARLS